MGLRTLAFGFGSIGGESRLCLLQINSRRFHQACLDQRVPESRSYLPVLCRRVRQGQQVCRYRQPLAVREFAGRVAIL
jgi:hypothetical protein